MDIANIKPDVSVLKVRGYNINILENNKIDIPVDNEVFWLCKLRCGEQGFMERSYTKLNHLRVIDKYRRNYVSHKWVPTNRVNENEFIIFFVCEGNDLAISDNFSETKLVNTITKTFSEASDVLKYSFLEDCSIFDYDKEKYDHILRVYTNYLHPDMYNT